METEPVEVVTTGIAINSLPSLLVYSEEDTVEDLDIQGLTIKVTYSDGNSDILGVSLDMIDVEMGTVGFAQVLISYGGHQASFNIEIK